MRTDRVDLVFDDTDEMLGVPDSYGAIDVAEVSSDFEPVSFDGGPVATELMWVTAVADANIGCDILVVVVSKVNTMSVCDSLC